MIITKQSDLIYKDCIIIPFENLEGKIIAITQSKRGTEFEVRYFLGGEYKVECFFDFDLELKEQTGNNDN